jgi:hypothetical protein
VWADGGTNDPAQWDDWPPLCEQFRRASAPVLGDAGPGPTTL